MRATAPQPIEAPRNYRWIWDGDGWRPSGWDPEAEAAAAALLGDSGLAIAAASAAMSACGPSPESVAGAVAWVTWVGGRAVPLPHEAPLCPALLELIASHPPLLLRAVNAKHCLPALLDEGLRSVDPAIQQAALAHQRLPYDLRCRAMIAGCTEHLYYMARAETTPLDRLREMTAPGYDAAVRIAAITNEHLPEAEAAEAVMSMDASTLATFAGSNNARLNRLVLANCTEPDILYGFLMPLPPLRQETLWRLIDMEDASLDSQLARHYEVRSNDQAASTITDRAIRLLPALSEAFPETPDDLVCAAALLTSVLAHRLWRTCEQEDALLSWLFGLDEKNRAPLLDAFTDETVTALAGTWAQATLEAMDARPRRTLGSVISSDAEPSASRMIQTARDIPAALFERAARDPRLSVALLHRDPTNAELAKQLQRRFLGNDQALITVAHPSIRPEMRERAYLQGQRWHPPFGSVGDQVGRYRYDPARPGWVVGRTGNPANRERVLARIVAAPDAGALMAARYGLRAAIRAGAFSDPQRCDRLEADLDLYEEAFRRSGRRLGPTEEDASYQAVHELRAGLRDARRLLDIHASMSALRPASIPELDGSIGSILATAEHRLGQLARLAS